MYPKRYELFFALMSKNPLCRCHSGNSFRDPLLLKTILGALIDDYPYDRFGKLPYLFH